MEHPIPRIVLAGTRSGCGKTTVTCAILRALTTRGRTVAAFKCGPDYIDPMFHRHITGNGANLDPFFFDPNTLRYLLAKHAEGRDIAVLEGVMGLYDGVGMTARASTYETARLTGSPVVLIVGANGVALSALAEVQGFLDFVPDAPIRGVIFNRCSAGLYPVLAEELRRRFPAVRPLGYLPALPDGTLESRHLGLVTAAEVADLDRKLDALAASAEKSLDLDGLLSLARAAEPIVCEPVALPRFAEGVRIAVARDRAFCFYYEDSLGVLEAMGAALVPFSPLSDEALPPEIDGLILGGGYPELYARELSENGTMRASVRAALERGLPCIAECGGFLYLTERIGEFPMAGFLSGTCRDTGGLSRFGYITLRAKRDNLLCRAGEAIPAHEFHRWDCDEPGACFTAEKPNGRRWDCAVAADTFYAGFPHFHFYAEPRFAVRYYEACLKEKHRHG